MKPGRLQVLEWSLGGCDWWPSVLLKQTGPSLGGVWCQDTVTEPPQPLFSVCSTTLRFLGQYNFHVVFYHRAWEFYCVGGDWEKEHVISVLIWSPGENTWWAEGDSESDPILLLILYGSQFPHIYIHEKTEFYVISKVSFITKTLQPLKWPLNQESCVVSTIQLLFHSFLKIPTLIKHSNLGRYVWVVYHMWLYLSVRAKSA